MKISEVKKDAALTKKKKKKPTKRSILPVVAVVHCLWKGRNAWLGLVFSKRKD
jgi:hypothetical protein